MLQVCDMKRNHCNDNTRVNETRKMTKRGLMSIDMGILRTKKEIGSDAR